MSRLSGPVNEGIAAWRRDARHRAEAFRAAGRHSARVRFLKWAIVIGSVAGIGLVAVLTFFDPFRHVQIAGFSIDSVGINGSKVTMERPHVTGFRADGTPYRFDAKTMTQDLRHPNAFDLDGVEGEFSMGDKQPATLTAKTGHYDNAANTMDLQGDIHVRNDAGYEAFLDTAHIDFKTSAVDSSTPVRVLVDTTTVVADTLALSDNGRKLVFDGHVKSVMVPTAEAKQATAALKGTSP